MIFAGLPNKVMVVDDTPANLKLLDSMLRQCGYRVLTFPGGEMALKAAETAPPDLFLLDISMPGMNGFELCANIKAHPVLCEIPVIFISALNETPDKVRAFEVGGVDYVTKPFQFEEVKARVETHLRLREMQIALKKYNHHLDGLVREKVKEIGDAQMATIFALAKLAESRDDDTGKHLERTQVFCRLISEHLARRDPYAGVITPEFISNIECAAPLHDIGKVGVSDSILLKPGKLDPDEFNAMKKHTEIGAATLAAVREKYAGNLFLEMGIAIARSHHEKWDGSGYPDGLAGEEIPLCARIMALADVYDALRSERVYKPAFTHAEAREIIFGGAGSHFDPVIVAVFSSVEPAFEETNRRLREPASAGRH